ncbi:helix-turn-helix domain-containing protein [Pseudoxanthomonas winnipegensis]|uniref:helix-turn-helix transcriptional regulator n=1 Tax=Pseudoxanthomonas winnipegensis TaxID=2480810 RepID=UPI002575C598|nr:helix-turn-helix domain-containing protein [Pseudoxanthomonas winnipegensis]WJI14953.1 helix-turn-helix domain-containing protein [Pseudoxanthomonas winnipegensis]
MIDIHKNLAAERLKGPDAAKYLGCSHSTLEKMRHEGRGPRYVKLGGRVFYRKSDLDAYVEAAVVETTESRAKAG